MHELECDSPACRGYLTASDKHDLMRQVEQHLKDAHKVEKPSQTMLSYLASTAREVPAPSQR